MLTALTALLISSLAGGIFGSVAIYTYMDSSEGKYCEKISDQPSEQGEYSDYYGDYNQDEYEEDMYYEQSQDQNSQYESGY